MPPPRVKLASRSTTKRPVNAFTACPIRSGNRCIRPKLQRRNRPVFKRSLRLTTTIKRPDSRLFMSEPQQRKIIHCDCDCFYAAVEMRDDPRLRGRPLAVGGRAETRGVIATCNYEARAFGVHSAMPTARALQLCSKLILLPPDFERYREASRRILAIYRDYTALVEPLSLDEAYLDVSGVDRCRGSASLMAHEIRERIHHEVRITASAGLAPNQ